ncbi:MAG: hypothetical protein ACJAVN_000969 [Roseivirga sp.]|jgi:hypothetical protein
MVMRGVMLRECSTNCKQLFYTFSVILMLGFISACGSGEGESELESKTSATLPEPIFKEISFTQSGINFLNTIREDETHNFFNYNYIYNGSGLAIGDFNNDDLKDIYFVSNQSKNKLFLNKGNLKFQNITDSAGVAALKGWKNGVTVVDINQDGLDDIYLSRSGRYEDPDQRANFLYINNGDLTFTESAAQYGLADKGYGIQAYFFDYDRDGDLDLYQMNHRLDFNNKNTIMFLRNEKPEDYDAYSRDRLYENKGGRFVDVSNNAGIFNSAWGLSAVMGDFNEDGWEDIYVANDYLTPDFLYINNQDGTFTESIQDYFQHMSFFSMGSDWADIDNNGHFDLVTLDMAPEDHVRSKRLMASMSNEFFRTMVDEGLQHQYMINTLQYNHGGGNYSEVSQVSGIDKTDWSWTALFGDYDVDGLKDLYVTNGIRKDITDNDAAASTDSLYALGKQLALGQVLKLLPSQNLQNPVFKNVDGLKFKRSNIDWGMKRAFNSNGAVYSDLDNDGDLEIITNNMDLMCTLYQNLTVENKDKKMRMINVKGPKGNREGFGTTLRIKTSDGKEVLEKVRGSRGYLSSSDPAIYVAESLDIQEIEVMWPTGQTSVLKSAEDLAKGTIDFKDAVFQNVKKDQVQGYFTKVDKSIIDFKHEENQFDDFLKEILLPHRQSEHGPFISKSDVNGDGLEDVYVGGARDQSGSLFVQTTDGKYSESSQATFLKDRAHEDMNATFFDVDGDQDMDLYVVSGSGEFYQGNSRLLRDRLYLNDGKGNYSRAAADALPNDQAGGSKALPSDIDGDGDQDLIIINRNVPGEYPKGAKSFIYINEGGRFVNDTKNVSTDFYEISQMLTDGVMIDIDQNGFEDLVVVGEWMSPKIFMNDGGEFEEEELEMDNLKGWWQSVKPTDIDNDGDIDFVVGNIGLNNKFHPKPDSPLLLFYNDFDKNGIGDIVLSKSNGGELLPVRGRECSSQQMPFILEKFDNYEKFANADLTAIYSEERLDASLKLEVNNFASGILINNGDMNFEFKELPSLSQFGAVRDVIIKDVNKDGLMDFICGGNFYGSEVETVRYDSNFGSIVINKGNGNFETLSLEASGLVLNSDVRDLETVTVKNEEYLLVTSNNDEVRSYKFSKRP